jgi:predicted P-loop ATPase
MSIHIAVGKSKRELNWRNKETTWDQFIERLREPVRTAEKVSEYKAMTRPQQGPIKDVGGFVAGYIDNGRRKIENIRHRSMITLDVDFAEDTDILDMVDILYGCKSAMYTTHAHTTAKPRLRLILPLSRNVNSDEYQAISRRVAGSLGINQFDDTTYQPERLMYWPSVSRDGYYKFDHRKGPELRVESILEEYEDWTDCSSWPISDRVSTVIQRTIKKQGDPLEKPGAIGAFCRCYSIQDAIEEFLDGVYAPAEDGRYTFLAGTSASGLVIYENKFAFSHHSTDPTSMRLCNAFDLVRIHRFGLKDEDAKPDCAANRLPSYTEMTHWCSELPEVKKVIVSERMAEVIDDFKDVKGEPVDTEWTQLLQMSSKMKVLSTIDNTKIILENDPKYNQSLAYNELSKRVTRMTDREALEDVDDAKIRHHLEKTYEVTGLQKISDATLIVAYENAYNPVKEYLDTLEWDGEERLDTLLIDYQGAERTEYTKQVTRKSMVACIARMYEPGTKFDYVLTMVGKQGTGKSTLLRFMGKDWFTDSFSTVIGKEAVEQILGFWVIEMAELAGLRKAEVEQVKHFITKQDDTFRQAYGRRTETFKRMCVFFGTTNSDSFLNDITGNRRFWVVPTMVTIPEKRVFNDLRDNVDQIWAEAIAGYKAGEKLYLDHDMEEEAVQKQKDHTKGDDRTGIVLEYLETRIPSDFYQRDISERIKFIHNQGDGVSEVGTVRRDTICAAEIWEECFNGKRKDLERRKSNEIGAILAELSGIWERQPKSRRITGYGAQRVYTRIT